jgi:AhpD family alkylhydroperoxidase
MSDSEPLGSSTVGDGLSSSPTKVAGREPVHHIDGLPHTPPARDEDVIAMKNAVYPVATVELAQRRKDLAPATHAAFQAFSRQVFAAGAVDQKTKQLIAVAVAHVTQCPYCIAGHTKAALRKGASEAELIEAIWVAAEMRAGGAYAHSLLALETAAHGHAHMGGPDAA